MEIVWVNTLVGSNPTPSARRSGFEPRRLSVVRDAAQGADRRDERGSPKATGAQSHPIRWSVTFSYMILPTRSRGNVFSGGDDQFRGVAQFGRALRSGRRGPRFKSGRPDFIRRPYGSAAPGFAGSRKRARGGRRRRTPEPQVQPRRENVIRIAIQPSTAETTENREAIRR